MSDQAYSLEKLAWSSYRSFYFKIKDLNFAQIINNCVTYNCWKELKTETITCHQFFKVVYYCSVGAGEDNMSPSYQRWQRDDPSANICLPKRGWRMKDGGRCVYCSSSTARLMLRIKCPLRFTYLVCQLGVFDDKQPFGWGVITKHFVSLAK